ncbi:MAG TPA: hypothetical protein GXX35_06800 [Thermoanaerobacterales bacterium]|nr:hypothetical protein [Thermoanaerobacterales bacterium]
MNDWHSDFYAAIKQLFKDEDLKIIQEEYLSKGPLRIDVIIIKNLDSHQIKKQIGKIFKKYNNIEYKSPTDYKLLQITNPVGTPGIIKNMQ